MKIAITADVHLASFSETPERYNALEDMINQVLAENIDKLFICGDLFHQDFNNYTDFEKLASLFYKKVQIFYKKVYFWALGWCFWHLGCKQVGFLVGFGLW